MHQVQNHSSLHKKFEVPSAYSFRANFDDTFFSKILSPKFETFFHSNIFLRVKKLIINVPIECASAPPSYASFKKKYTSIMSGSKVIFDDTKKAELTSNLDIHHIVRGSLKYYFYFYF